MGTDTPVFDTLFFVGRGAVDDYVEKNFPHENEETEKAWNELDGKIDEAVPAKYVNDLFEAIIDYTSRCEQQAFRNGLRLAFQLWREFAGKEAP